MLKLEWSVFMGMAIVSLPESADTFVTIRAKDDSPAQDALPRALGTEPDLKERVFVAALPPFDEWEWRHLSLPKGFGAELHGTCGDFKLGIISYKGADLEAFRDGPLKDLFLFDFEDTR